METWDLCTSISNTDPCQTDENRSFSLSLSLEIYLSELYAVSGIMRLENRRWLSPTFGNTRPHDEPIVPVGFVSTIGLIPLLFNRYHQSNHSRVSDRQLSPDREVYGSSNEYRIPQRVRTMCRGGDEGVSMGFFSPLGLADRFHQSIRRFRRFR